MDRDSIDRCGRDATVAKQVAGQEFERAMEALRAKSRLRIEPVLPR